MHTFARTRCLPTIARFALSLVVSLSERLITVKQLNAKVSVIIGDYRNHYCYPLENRCYVYYHYNSQIIK